MEVSKKSQIEQLFKLKQLYESGVLTKEEMEAEKAKILGTATPKDECPTKEAAPVETQVSSTDSTTNEEKHRSHNKSIIGIAITAIIIVVGIIVLNLNRQNESAYDSKDDVELSQQTGIDSRNGNGEQETEEADMNARQVAGTLTAYYAKNDIQKYYIKKGQLICDSNTPTHRMVEVDDNNYKHEGYDRGRYWSVSYPKAEVTKKEYTMHQLTINDIGDKSVFVSNEGGKATIFRSKINGHHYLGYDGEVDWEETNNHKECYVVSIRSSNYSIEQPLREKGGVIDFYDGNRDDLPNYWNRYQEGIIGIISDMWWSGENWAYESAYDEYGNLLVDQRPFDDGIPRFISIAYIADFDALYISGDLYYRKLVHEDDSQRLVDDNNKNEAVKMPTIQDISRFSDDYRNSYKAILDYGFTLVDRQSRKGVDEYDETEIEYELIKEVYYLKYNSDSRTSEIFDGNMTITCVNGWGDECITIECDKTTWNKLKREAEHYLKSFEMPETYWLNYYWRICFEHEGVIEITGDMSNCW